MNSVKHDYLRIEYPEDIDTPVLKAAWQQMVDSVHSLDLSDEQSDVLVNSFHKAFVQYFGHEQLSEKDIKRISEVTGRDCSKIEPLILVKNIVDGFVRYFDKQVGDIAAAT